MGNIQTIFAFVTNSPVGLGLFALVFPLFSFFVLMFVKSNKVAHSFALGTMAICFVASLGLLYYTYTYCAFTGGIPWLEIGSIELNISITLDKIASLMLSMVSLITLLVMLYSTEYMRGEKRYNYFFAYISLFAFAMFGLILSRNLLWTYIFWEMVGFCSYLLIGFYTQKNSAILANKKAFIINRIGDVGFLVGIMILLSVFRTLDLSSIFNLVQERSVFISATDKMLLHYAGYAFFIGVIAKSAQFPLHVWLPDAMEGPTPVSALIHAATMVISGVYLLIRIFFLLDAEVLHLIVLIGSFTAFMGSFIAGRQFDIKKILAYSTISQLGYMVMAIGLSAPMAAFYHLYTHAFFKAALFLGAGSIIHYLHHQFEIKKIKLDPQDIRNMGALRKELPFTFMVYTLASAALIGLPFVTGFFSKEAILTETWRWASMHGDGYFFVPVFAFGSVVMTAFYVFRHYTLVFFGKTKNEYSREKESIAFIIPFIILGIACIYMYPLYHPIVHYIYLPYITVFLMLIGIGAAYFICYRKLIKPFNENNIIYKLSYHAFYLDTVYQYLFTKPIHYLLTKLQPVDFKFDNDMVHGLGNVVIHFSHLMAWIDKNVFDALVNFIGTMGVQLSYFAAWLDKNVIDGVVLLVAKLARRGGDFIRAFQTGKVQSYFALSAVLLIVFIWFFMRGV